MDSNSCLRRRAGLGQNLLLDSMHIWLAALRFVFMMFVLRESRSCDNKLIRIMVLASLTLPLGNIYGLVTDLVNAPTCRSNIMTLTSPNQYRESNRNLSLIRTSITTENKCDYHAFVTGSKYVGAGFIKYVMISHLH